MPRSVLSRVMPVWTQLRFGIWAATTAVYWCGLAVLMHVPPGSTPKQPGWFSFPHADKVVHGAMYAVLTVLIVGTRWSYQAMRKPPSARFSRAAAWTVVGIVAAYGLLDELTQPLTGRNCEASDLATDVAAAFLVIAAIRGFQTMVDRSR